MMDDHRIYSKQTLQFSIECGGGNRKSVSTGYGGENNLVIVGRMMATEAARTCNWHLSQYQPIYVLITVNLRIAKPNNEEEAETRKGLLKQHIIPVRKPSIHRVTDMVAKMLTGPVIKSSAQICAIMAIKKQSTDREFIEVFVGVPNGWKELNHDIRNG